MTDKINPQRSQQTSGTGSEQLPKARSGASHTVSNTTDQPMHLKPTTGDTVQGQQKNDVYVLEPGKTARFTCNTDGVWTVQQMRDDQE